jgi:hypothetical protein
MPVTVRGSDVLFNDGTTQATSFIPSSYSGLGGYIIAALNITSAVKPGDTVAGSSLYVLNTITTVTANWNLQSQGTTANPTTRWEVGGTGQGQATQATTGNVGYQVPAGASTQSGTWRVLWPIPQRRVIYDFCGNTTFSYTYATLLQRIA